MLWCWNERKFFYEWMFGANQINLLEQKNDEKWFIFLLPIREHYENEELNSINIKQLVNRTVRFIFNPVLI